MEVFRMEKKKCIGDHAVHICEIAKKDEYAEIVTLTKDPHYLCMQCGRVAHAGKNLCNPLAFDKIPFAIAH